MNEKTKFQAAALVVLILVAVGSIFWVQGRRGGEEKPQADVAIPMPPGIQGPG
jgi:hypothetical protein